MTPHEAALALLRAVAQSPDRSALEVPALHLIKALNDAGFPTPPLSPKPPEIHRAHAYARRRFP